MRTPMLARRAAVSLLVILPRLVPNRAQSYFAPCDGQYQNVADEVVLRNGEAALREITANHTHRFLYTNYNMTTMVKNDTDRKVIVSLEPCYGVVYLFVRKNIPCHPDPYSCINLDTGLRDAKSCRRTHFMSKIDGSRDGAPTFFQLSLSATSYYISVFATQDSRYSLTFLDDVGAWPRRGNNGMVQAGVVSEGTVMLQWSIATYFPLGITGTKQYYVYAVPLVPEDNITNVSVFLRPRKILNTYCGLLNNSDRSDDIVPEELCDGTCNTTISGLISGRKYAFNIVAESHRGFRMAYAGTVMGTTWSEVSAVVEVPVAVSAGARRLLAQTTSTPMDSQDMQVVGAVMGSVLGMVGMAGMILLRYTS